MWVQHSRLMVLQDLICLFRGLVDIIQNLSMGDLSDTSGLLIVLQKLGQQEVAISVYSILVIDIFIV